MNHYPENRNNTHDQSAPFPTGDADPYFVGKATKYVDNLTRLVHQHDPQLHNEPHPIDRMMRRVSVEQYGLKAGHATTFKALCELASAWGNPDDPRNDFAAVSEGAALALVFVRESHIIPSQYDNFSEELSRMQHYGEHDAEIAIADFTDNVWQGMQRDHPIVHQLFSEMSNLLIEHRHVDADDPQTMRIKAGMGLVYMISVASKLLEATGKFSTCDDYFDSLGLEPGETRRETVDDWRDLEPVIVPDLRATIGSDRPCIHERDRNPPLPMEIVRQRKVLAELASELVNAKRKHDYEVTKDRTRSVLGAFLRPDQGAAKEQRRKREAIEDQKTLREYEEFFDEDE